MCVNDGARSIEFSASSSQNCSNAYSGRLSLLPAIIAAFIPPIDVPASICLS